MMTTNPKIQPARSVRRLLPFALFMSLVAWAAAVGDPADRYPGLNLIP